MYFCRGVHIGLSFSYMKGCMCWMTGWLGRKRGNWNGMEWNYVGEGNIGQLRLQFVAMIGYIYDTQTQMSFNT
jgi:hypothetical protein